MLCEQFVGKIFRLSSAWMMILEERKLKSYEIYRDILYKGRIAAYKQKLNRHFSGSWSVSGLISKWPEINWNILVTKIV